MVRPIAPRNVSQIINLLPHKKKNGCFVNNTHRGEQKEICEGKRFVIKSPTLQKWVSLKFLRDDS